MGAQTKRIKDNSLLSLPVKINKGSSKILLQLILKILHLQDDVSINSKFATLLPLVQVCNHSISIKLHVDHKPNLLINWISFNKILRFEMKKQFVHVRVCF